MPGMSRDEFLAMSREWQDEKMEALMEKLYDRRDRNREIDSWPEQITKDRFRKPRITRM